MKFRLLRFVVFALIGFSMLAVGAYVDWRIASGSEVRTGDGNVLIVENDQAQTVEAFVDSDETLPDDTAARLTGTLACAVPVLPHNGSTTNGLLVPSTRLAYSRGVYLIRPSELAASGYQPGSSPTALSWTYQTAPSISGAAPLRILLQNTSDTTYTKGTSFSAAIGGMTVVHNASTTLPAAAGPFSVNFSGGAPFTYTGGGLYVAFDWGSYNGTLSAEVRAFGTTGFANGFAGASSFSDTLTQSSVRPETRLNGSPVPQADAAVTAVYSVGELPLGRVPAQNIKAVITNKGSQPLTNLPVTLNITGDHAFGDVQTIPFLSSCGAQAVVTFAVFDPATLGNDTVTITVPPDEVSANNSQSKALNITANDYSYRYPGSTLPGGTGFGVPGVNAAKFTVSSVQTVEAVKLDFYSVTAATYRVAIYADNGGVPSTTQLYVDSFDRTVSAPGPTTIPLESPVTVGPGAFYVGVQQTSTEPYFYAFENELPIRTGTFFRSFSLFPEQWQDVAPARIKFNIGVVLRADQPSPTPTPSAVISGSVTYGNAIGAPTQRFVSNVTVSGSGSPNVVTITGAPGPSVGQYALSGFGAGSYTVTPTKAGGVNSAISSFDAAKIAQHVAAVSTLTGNQLVVADVSGNGTLSSFDAGQIARWVAALPGFGSTSSWIFSPINRVYASVNSSISGEDYSAFLMGEVSGNWANSGARPIENGKWKVENDNRSETDKPITVTVQHLATAAEKDIVVPVNVQGVAGKEVISYEFDLRYDPSVVQPRAEPVDVSGTISRGLSVVTNATEPGLLRVVVYGAVPISGDGVLLNLRFTAVGRAGSGSALTWERIMFNEGETTVTVTDGMIEILAALPLDVR